MTLISRGQAAFHALIHWLTPARRVLTIHGDSLPAVLPRRALVHVLDDGESWSVGFRCPCGCGAALELMLLPGVNPRWDMVVDARGRPTLSPSIWRNEGCRSHFWVRDGKVVWCH